MAINGVKITNNIVSVFLNIYFLLTRSNRILLYFVVSFNLSLALSSCGPTNIKNPTDITRKEETTTIIRIGYQPHGSILLLKNLGNLEKRLAKIGVIAEWKKYSSGPPIISAMGKGEVDLGYAGDVPALLAQIENLPFVYVANDLPVPTMMVILVSEESSIKNLADLKGKKITFIEGSSGHYMLIQALISAGLTLDEVKVAPLSASEGKIAFENGKVDVWVGWDPYWAELEEKMPVRILTNGEGIADNTNFYLATRSLVENNYALVKIFIEELQKTGEWAANNSEDVAKFLAQEAGLEISTARKIVRRNIFEVLPIQDRAIEEQQRIADIFFRLGIFPKQVRVEDMVWKGRLNEGSRANLIEE